jgi:hypothetical protein
MKARSATNRRTGERESRRKIAWVRNGSAAVGEVALGEGLLTSGLCGVGRPAHSAPRASHEVVAASIRWG